MRHRSSRELFNHWNQLRGRRLAPERGEIDPGAIRTALGDSFILALAGDEDPRFRLAGTRVCALFCRELKGSRFGALWDEASRAEVHELAVTTAHETVGALAGVTGQTIDGPVEFEMLLLPLFHHGRMDARLIAVLSPVTIPRQLGTEPIRVLTLGSHRRVGPLVEPRPPASLPAGRSRRSFVVYQGGRT